MLRRPARTPLFPYTTLFRSRARNAAVRGWFRNGLGGGHQDDPQRDDQGHRGAEDRKSTRLNSSHPSNSYAVFSLKKKNETYTIAAAIAAYSSTSFHLPLDAQ